MRWGHSLYEFINTLRHTDLSACLEKLTVLVRTYKKPELCRNGVQ